MKLGAEPRKLGLLAVLGVAAVYLFYTNVLSPGTPPPRPASRPQASSAPASRSSAAVRPQPVRPAAANTEFRASLIPDRREQRPDPMTIDPTLRLDLLAKVREVKFNGGGRNLFQFGKAPAPPKPPEPKVIPKTPEQMAAEAKPLNPPKPPAAAIPLKFYGYASPVQSGEKRAFFLDGEDIVVAGEGELIRKRYKVVGIGVNTAVIEDIELKNQQTLALEEIS